jgi:hypothetical protein
VIGLITTLFRTTRAFRRRTDRSSSTSTRLCLRICFQIRFYFTRVTALLCALLLVVATVTLFSLFYDLIATEGPVVLLEAVLFPLAAEHRLQDGGDVSDGAGGELVVVRPLA